MTEMEGKIPDISNSATKTVLISIENKILDVSSLVEKADYSTKITEIEHKLNNHNHDKYIDTPELNQLAGDVFNARLAQANLKTKVITNANTKYILSWQSKGLSDETIKPPATGNYKLNPKVSYYGTKVRLEFRGSCLKQDKTTFNYGKVVTIYIVYELDSTNSISSDSTLINCLFGVVSITKNANIDKYKYFGYEIGFDRRSLYLLPAGRFGRNVIIFGVDVKSSVHIDNKGKEVLILGNRPTQGLGEHPLTA